MAENITKLPVKTEENKAATALRPWRPFENLRREIDRVFEDFGGGMWRSPFRRSFFDFQPFTQRESSWAASPAVDIAETEKAYEITAELPGIDEKNVEVKFANGVLTIKGEKQEQKEEKKKDYYLSERNYGSFQRAFQVPDSVDTDKIEATFKNGVLTVTLPKSAEAQKAAKKSRSRPPETHVCVDALIRIASNGAVQIFSLYRARRTRRACIPAEAGSGSADPSYDRRPNVFEHVFAHEQPDMAACRDGFAHIPCWSADQAFGCE